MKNQYSAPKRNALGETEKLLAIECIDYYLNNNSEMSYGSEFENRYSKAFVKYLMGRDDLGFAKPVNSGTNGIYVSIKSLGLPVKSTILVSPITDPGTLNAIIIAGYTPKIVDSNLDNFNICVSTLERRIDSKCSAILVVHSFGFPADLDGIVTIANKYGLKIIEDCSQAHGASYKGNKVGTFGDIAIFSTMYSKAHINGSSGGIIFTKNLALKDSIKSYSDRGKNFASSILDNRDPSNNINVSLNFNSSEISCAIGIASLSRLDETIRSRINFCIDLRNRLSTFSYIFVHNYDGSESPFSIPITFNDSLMLHKVSKAFSENDIPHNPIYKQVVTEWNWIKHFLSDNETTPNAIAIRDKTIFLYVNENYTSKDALHIYNVINSI